MSLNILTFQCQVLYQSRVIDQVYVYVNLTSISCIRLAYIMHTELAYFLYIHLAYTLSIHLAYIMHTQLAYIYLIPHAFIISIYFMHHLPIGLPSHAFLTRTYVLLSFSI